MRTHIRGELTDLPRTGAAELAVAQEGPYVVIVAVAVSGLAGTFACTVCLDMANLHLTRIDVVTAQTKTKNGQYALTALASATLLNLNGLKSSLTCTGVFLSATFPKKGLGTGGEVEDYGLSEISGLHVTHI